MRALDAEQIRASFVNLLDTERVPVPPLHEVIWQEREYLGWRDPQNRHRGYLVHWLDDAAIGLALSASTSVPPPGVAAMCSLCHSARPSPQVTMFSAPRAGQAGVNGNTVGTYVCDDLACSHMLRHVPPGTAVRSAEEILAERIAGLEARLAGFTARVMSAP